MSRPPLDDLKPAYDAIVVGARCAGAATAMLLARDGLRVLALDRSPRGLDTLSTHALMRGAVLQLHRWGLLDEVRRANTPAIRTTTFHYGDGALELAIDPRDGVDALYAPRRTLLDTMLAAEAARSGAEVVHGLRVADVIERGGRVRGIVVQDDGRGERRLSSGIVVGADGVKSTIARATNSAMYDMGRHAAAVIYAYWAGVPLSGYHWYYRPRVSAGVIPTNDGLTCVFASAPADRFARELRFDFEAGYHRILDEVAPDLASMVRSGVRAGGFHPFAGQHGFMRQSWGPGWALVGDAAHFKDPITAHGITDALRDAELLARAIVEGTDGALARYQAERDGLSRGIHDATDEIASFDWDLTALQKRHRDLSREMSREVARLRELDVRAVCVAS